MAAPTLSGVQGQRGTIRSKTEKKKPSYKNVLLDPHPAIWPVINESVQQEILEKIKSVFSSLSLGRPVREKNHVKIGSKKEQKKQREEERKKLEEEKQIRLTKNKPTAEEQLRSQLVMGINKVVRCLERGELRLAVIGRDVNQSLLSMTRHLIPLCLSRGCPAACISGVQTHIAPLLSVNSLLAFGIKTRSESESPALDGLVDFVSSRCEQLRVPWLMEDRSVGSTVDRNTNVANDIGSAADDCKHEESDNQNKTVEKITKKVELTANSKEMPQTHGKNSQLSKRTFQDVCDNEGGENFSKAVAISKMPDYSDLYIWKNSVDISEKGNTSSKTPDFIHIGLDNASDEEGDELVTYTLPKSSKTWEVNLGVSDRLSNVNPSFTKIRDDNRVLKRKAESEGVQKESVSKLKKAKIKQKKSNPNRQKGKKKKGKKSGGR